MGFGGGSSQSSTSSDSASWATNFLNSMSQQDSASDQLSESQGRTSSFIDPTQDRFLTGLWRQGAAATDPAAATKTATGLVGQTMPGMRAAFSGATALTDPKAQIAAQAKSLKAGLGNLWSDEIMPGIKSDAIAAGGFGGGRQGVAEGVGAGQLADTYAESMGDITANANNTALNAAGQAGSLGQGIFNLGMMPSMAGITQLQGLASLLGSPTVLTQALQDSMSKGRSRATGSSKSTGGGASKSASAMRSKSSDWNFSGWVS